MKTPHSPPEEAPALVWPRSAGDTIFSLERASTARRAWGNGSLPLPTLGQPLHPCGRVCVSVDRRRGSPTPRAGCRGRTGSRVVGRRVFGRATSSPEQVQHLAISLDPLPPPPQLPGPAGALVEDEHPALTQPEHVLGRTLAQQDGPQDARDVALEQPLGQVVHVGGAREDQRLPGPVDVLCGDRGRHGDRVASGQVVGQRVDQEGLPA